MLRTKDIFLDPSLQQFIAKYEQQSSNLSDTIVPYRDEEHRGGKQMKITKDTQLD